mmetsp:Transcript_39319/g.98359  ORF Transcript_39319/g.98359 Transcript_39319/m.98359 type:complete len:204 (-) Transcript_39319:59-670(-)
MYTVQLLNVSVIDNRRSARSPPVWGPCQSSACQPCRGSSGTSTPDCTALPRRNGTARRSSLSHHDAPGLRVRGGMTFPCCTRPSSGKRDTAWSWASAWGVAARPRHGRSSSPAHRCSDSWTNGEPNTCRALFCVRTPSLLLAAVEQEEAPKRQTPGDRPCHCSRLWQAPLEHQEQLIRLERRHEACQEADPAAVVAYRPHSPS